MIAVIDYEAGNIRSVLFSLARLGVTPILTADIETILKADKVIFPGQGEASSAMYSLRTRGLDNIIPHLRQPFLGICVGMQLLCEHSEENDTTCLGVIPQKVVRFEGKGLKVPQIGWNTLQILENQADTEGGKFSPNIITPNLHNAWFYYVHSFYVEKGEYTTAITNYGDCEFSACLRKDNFYAAQFHPEKSSHAGEELLKNFLSI